MDDQHLLLALGPPDASALRHTESQQQAAFLAVYSLQVQLLSVHIALSPGVTYVRRQAPQSFNPMMTSCAGQHHRLDAAKQQLAAAGDVPAARRRVQCAGRHLPLGAVSRCTRVHTRTSVRRTGASVHFHDHITTYAPRLPLHFCRFLTPAGTPASARAAVDRQMAHQYWTMQQVGPAELLPAVDTLL